MKPRFTALLSTRRLKARALLIAGVLTTIVGGWCGVTQ